MKKVAGTVNWELARADDCGRLIGDLWVFLSQNMVGSRVHQRTRSEVDARTAARGVMTTQGQVWWQWLSEVFEG